MRITGERGEVFVRYGIKNELFVLVIVSFTDKIDFTYSYIVLLDFLFNISVKIGNFAANRLLLLFGEDGTGNPVRTEFVGNIEEG